MQSVSILSEDERRNWRRFERGLLVVQIGDADRPLTRAANFPESKTEALIGELVDRFPGLQTAITSKAVKDEVEQLLPDSELSEPVLHYNNELSRNDFAGEDIGLLVGCIDPGDHNVLSWLALHDAQAAPARSDEECGDCDGEGCYDCLGTGKQRALGRDFEGPDAEAAEALLASVREFHVAQSIGRYAREADQPEEFTVVFVWTAAVPEELVDLKIPDLRSLTQTQQEIVRCVEQSPEPVPTREVSDELDITKETARQTLAELAEAGPVTVHEGAGKHGAHLYDIDREVSGFLTLGDSDGSE